MANVDYIGDDILRNILAPLPGKSLLRFRCASKHWNCLISDPYFMKLRSRRMVLFPFLQPLVAIDDNVPVEDKAHSIVRIPSTLEGFHEVSIVGTFNGIVLLSLIQKNVSCQLMLYNPLTCASKLLTVMDPPVPYIHFRYVFGFGHGGDSSHDLKIVRFDYTPALPYKWDVFDLKTSSWSTPSQYIKQKIFFWGDVGVFLNGFLYWVIYGSGSSRLLVLNIKEMVFSKINLPDGINKSWFFLGTLGGCLCLIQHKFTGHDIYEMWLMKEECDESSWMKAHSFTFGNGYENGVLDFIPVCTLGNEKIVMTNKLIRFVIYDVSKGSHKTLDSLDTLDPFKRISDIFSYPRMSYQSKFKDIRSIEFVESLVSPSHICDFI